MQPIKHFVTITKHRHRVIVHCAKAGIIWRGLMHDLSKYSPTEFLQGAKYYTVGRSPNELERREIGYSKAWLHHKGLNRHHFEYWRDYNPKTHKNDPVKMPLIYVVEMFCDRIAANKIYRGKDYRDFHPLEYFRAGNANRSMHPETAELLEKLLVMLDEKGERVTFRYIRKDLLKKKDY